MTSLQIDPCTICEATAHRHGSAVNITPYPRKIVCLTLNAVSNYIRKPTRPEPVTDDALARLTRCSAGIAAD